VKNEVSDEEIFLQKSSFFIHHSGLEKNE